MIVCKLSDQHVFVSTQVKMVDRLLITDSPVHSSHFPSYGEKILQHASN